nr:hypothetical protein [Tanacetum cinerariifolium]
MDEPVFRELVWEFFFASFEFSFVACRCDPDFEGITFRVKEMDLLIGGMFITRIAKSFGLWTNLMVDALSVEPHAHVFRKKSLILMGIMMDLGGRTCCWPATHQFGEDDVVEEATNEEAGGSAEVYQNISQGDYHVRQA